MKYGIALLVFLVSIGSAWAGGHAVAYEVDGDAFEGWYVSPSEDAPLVLLVHDWDGLTAYEMKRAYMLADLGYAVFCADLFGAGNRPTTLEDKQKCTRILSDDRGRMRALMYGALDAARGLRANVDRAVAMGYCFGGTAVLEFARSGASMKGFVTFHGGLATPAGQDCSGVKGKVLILHGTADSGVTMEDFANLARDMESAGVPHEMITYGGAPHAFTVFGSDRYRKDADEKSWGRFVQFLDEACK